MPRTLKTRTLEPGFVIVPRGSLTPDGRSTIAKFQKSEPLKKSGRWRVLLNEFVTLFAISSFIFDSLVPQKFLCGLRINVLQFHDY